MTKKTCVLLAILISVHVIFNLAYLYLDQAPIPWDQANHTRTAVLLKNCFLGGGGNCLEISFYYPIFTHTITAVAFMLFGTSIKLAQFMGTLFFVGCIVAVFLFLKEFFKSEKTALLATTIFSLFPVIFHSSRYLWLEIPLLMNCFLSMYFLLKSKGFRNKKYTFLAFLFAGLATMTKWYTPVYLLIPFVFEFKRALKTPRDQKIHVKLENLLIGGFTFVLINLPWYIANISSILERILYYSKGDLSQPVDILSKESLLWYLDIGLKYQFGPLPFIVAIISLIAFLAFFRRADVNSKGVKIYSIAFILFNYIVFTLLENKDLRFTFIYIPFFAYFIAYSLRLLAKKLGRVFSALGYIPFVLVFGWLLFFHVNFTFAWPVQKPHKYVVKIPVFDWIQVINLSSYPITFPNNSAYPIKDVVTDINKLSKDEDVTVLVVFDYPRFNSTNLILQQLTMKDDDNYRTRIESFFVREGLKSDGEALRYLTGFDYALVTTNETSSGYFRFKKDFDRLQNALLEGDHQEIGRYKLPVSDIHYYLDNSSPPEMRQNRTHTCTYLELCDELVLYKINKGMYPPIFPVGD